MANIGKVTTKEIEGRPVCPECESIDVMKADSGFEYDTEKVLYRSYTCVCNMCNELFEFRRYTKEIEEVL